MKLHIATVVIAAGLGMVACAGGHEASHASLSRPECLSRIDATVAPEVCERTLPALPTEDATTNGYWDAAHRGNHRGVSFIVVDNTVYALSAPHRLSEDTASEITDGASKTCWQRIGDTTYTYCSNGHTYTS